MVGELPRLRPRIAHLELEPEAGNQAFGADGVTGGLESRRKSLAVDAPVAVLLKAVAGPLGPAVINYEILDAGVLEPTGGLEELQMGGIAPRGAPFVEHGREAVLNGRLARC